MTKEGGVSISGTIESFGANTLPTDIGEVVKKAEEGSINLVLASRLPILDRSITSKIKSLESQNLPLVVAVDSTFLKGHEDRAVLLSHIEGVDDVIVTGENLNENSMLRFRSNVHRISERKHNSLTRYRLTRPVSPFLEKSTDIDINNANYVDLATLEDLVAQYQSQGKNVVIVAGVFDVLHAGHAKFFAEARERGDILIVLTNSDYSASKQPKNKAKDRPINPLVDRVEVLSVFDSINHIASFDSENILPILEKLHGITYVKTTKDISPGVAEEIDLVIRRGGTTMVLPAIEDMAGEGFISSSGVIDKTRKRGTKAFRHSKASQLLSDMARGLVHDNFDVEYESVSPIFDGVVDEVLAYFLRLNSKTGILTTLRNEVISMQSNEMSERVALQVRAISRLYRALRDNLLEISSGGKATYASLVFKTGLNLIGIDAEMLPIQYADNDTHFGNIAAVKLSSGEMLFVDPSEGEIHEPFKFEERYHKLLPQHTSFQLVKDQKGFARRVYFETKSQRTKAMAMNVLWEVYGNNAGVQREIAELFGSVFADFSIEGRAPKIGQHMAEGRFVGYEVPRKINYPKIIAHGGLTSLDMAIVWAENSREAIIKAVKSSVDVLEVDIVPTSDGNWIASHFIDIGKISMHDGSSTDFTLSELQNIQLKDKDGRPTGSAFMGLGEVLAIIKEAGIPVKIDVKVKDPKLVNARSLVGLIQSSGISNDDVVVTCGDATITSLIRREEPKIGLELNTVEATNFLLANGLMKNPLMIDYFLDYIRDYAQKIDAKTVSLMQVAMNTWGDEVFGRLVDEIHKLGCEVQVWVATNVKEYDKDAMMGVDSVLMHNPSLIGRCMALRNKS